MTGFRMRGETNVATPRAIDELALATRQLQAVARRLRHAGYRAESVRARKLAEHVRDLADDLAGRPPASLDALR